MLRNQETSTTLCQTARLQQVMLSTLLIQTAPLQPRLPVLKDDASAITDEDAGKIITEHKQLFIRLQQFDSFQRFIPSKKICLQLTRVLSQNALTSLADTISTAEANNTSSIHISRQLPE